MPALEYFLVAESVSVDQTTNQVSIFNIIEDLRVPALPGALAQVAAVCAWNVPANEIGQDFQATFRVVAPGVESLNHAMNFTATQSRQRMIVRMIGVPIAAPGQLQFEVLLNGQHQASHTVNVTLEPPVVLAAQA
jgi:hypothetical protein